MAAVTGYDRTKRCCYRSCDDPARWVIRLWHYRRGVKAKEEARERAGRRCEGVLDDGSRCGAPSTATHQVHHRHGAQEGGRPRTASCAHHQAGLVFLCRSCHHLEHHPPQHPHPPRTASRRPGGVASEGSADVAQDTASKGQR